VIVGLTDAASAKASATVNDKPFTKKGDFLFLPIDAQLAVYNHSNSAEAQFAVFVLH
jgi:hypothetical protein